MLTVADVRRKATVALLVRAGADWSRRPHPDRGYRQAYRAVLARRDDAGIERADYYNVRFPKGTKFGGRFRKLSDVIIGTLEGWMNGLGDEDPLASFTQPQLKKAATQLGIDLPKPATKPRLKLLLLEKARRDVRAQRTENDEAAFNREPGATPYTPPIGTRRDVVGEDGARLGYMVREGGSATTPDTWAAYREDGLLLGHFSTVTEARERLDLRGRIPDGTRLRLAGETFAVRRDGRWEVHSGRRDLGAQGVAEDRVVGTVDTADEARELAAKEAAKRPRRPAPRREPAPAPRKRTGPTITVGTAPRRRTARERAADAVAEGRMSPDTATRLLQGESAASIVDSRTPEGFRDREYSRLTDAQRAEVDALPEDVEFVYWGRRAAGMGHEEAMGRRPAKRATAPAKRATTPRPRQRRT